MKSVLLFGAASLFVFVGAAAVSVYGFGQFEHAWGPAGSLQVESWLGLVAALVAMGAFGIGSAALHRVHSPASSLVLGSACAVVYICLCWSMDAFATARGVYAAFLLLVAVSAAASLAGQRSAG